MNALTQADSPLAEPSALSLDELFQRDPLSLSDRDIDTIVEELRRSRAKFNLVEKEKVTGKKSASPQLSLDDLDLNDIKI